MRKIFLIVLICLLTVPVFATEDDNNLRQAIEEAEKKLEGIKNGNISLTKKIIEERKTLESELYRLREDIIKKKRGKELEDKSSTFLQTKKELKDILLERDLDVEKFKSSLRETTSVLEGLLHNSIIYVQNQDRYFQISDMLTEKSFFDEEYLKKLIDTALYEIEQSGKIVKYEGQVFKQDGNACKGEIIRFGKIGAAFKEKGKRAQFLYFSPTSRNLFITSADKRESKALLGKYFRKDDKKDILSVPLDITGKVLAKTAPSSSIIDKIKKGGIIIWPILLIGIVGIIIIIERFVTLNKVSVNTEYLVAEVTEDIKKGNWEMAEKSCYNNPGAVSNILLTGIKNRENSKEVLEDSLQEAILHQLPKLEKHLPTLSVLGAVAPLLGLLGTVMGMITTFDVISVLGVGDPRMMSGGISEALITTQFGLIMAIPIILFHNFLSGKVDNIISDMEKNAVALVNVITSKN
ncbi:MAG: MotA/TolQ/ExbB proton channel family protein [bacterium]|nr:MotA/TolQ/ExbB proton channel family protein [bacterium]